MKGFRHFEMSMKFESTVEVGIVITTIGFFFLNFNYNAVLW